MATTVSQNVLNHWNTLKYLDNNTKLDIIAMLTQSLKHPEKRKKISATTEEFIDELKKERKFRQDIVEL